MMREREEEMCFLATIQGIHLDEIALASLLCESSPRIKTEDQDEGIQGVDRVAEKETKE
jgi:hypothetical protein